MNDKELIRELKRLSVRDSLQCLGCGHEHGCSTQDSAMTASSGHAEFNCAQPLDVAVAQSAGCAIIKQAMERLAQLTAPEPNDPLTPEELRKMDGEAVWVHCPTGGFNAVVCIQRDGRILLVGARGGRGEYVDLDRWAGLNMLKIYRRKPEEMEYNEGRPFKHGKLF